MLKVHENPPLFWPPVESIRLFEGQWWVAHTKSRNEKALAHDLKVRNISYFLPMTWKVRQHSHRTIKSLLPLFTGYMFFCGSEHDRLEVLRTNRVAGLIEVHDQHQLVDELTPIERLLRKGAPLKPHKYIEAGQRCRVTAGALAGAEGIVVQTSRETRLVMQVDILGQATSVEVEMEMIELLD